MKRKKQQQLRECVERWRSAGPELEAIRREELTRFDQASNWQLVDALLEAGLRSGGPRTTSGLVEMQRWFRRIARRGEQSLRKPDTSEER